VQVSLSKTKREIAAETHEPISLELKVPECRFPQEASTSARLPGNKPLSNMLDACFQVPRVLGFDLSQTRWNAGLNAYNSTHTRSVQCCHQTRQVTRLRAWEFRRY
jgi:hypothetical protein